MRLLLIALLFLGCSRDKNESPQISGTLPGITSKPALKQINVLAGGQSNMTLIINGNQGTPIYFIQDLYKHGIDSSLGLVAYGGSSQQDWQIGGAYYIELVTKAKSMGHIDVFIWWQGEAEGATMVNPQGQPQPIALAQSWGQNFTAFVRAVRQELNQPDLPVIFCQIGQNPGYPNDMLDSWEEVKRQQEMIYLPNVFMIKTDTIADFHGWFHTDEHGYRIIADQMAERFLTLIQ